MRDQDREASSRCDTILVEALDRMEGAKIPIHVTLDRLFTRVAFASVQYAGKAHTVEQMRAIADNIEAGIFDGIGSQKGRG